MDPLRQGGNRGSKRPSRFKRLALFGGMALAAGCEFPASQQVPDWAQHVKASGVNPTYPRSTAVQRLTWEMGQPRLMDGHLAPEQIAFFALSDIEQGHPADAALWLAIAAYRYRQEAFAAMLAWDRVPYNVRPGPFRELVKAEFDRYIELDFYPQIEGLRARVYGQSERDTALQDQLLALGKTSAVDREALRDALVKLRPQTNSVAPSQYPTLVFSFRRRLLEDFAHEHEDFAPAHYLGITPIPTLQRDAATVASRYFLPSMCAGVADGLPLVRSDMITALSATRPEVRANAAAILALGPLDETRALLEARLAVETDGQVKLALAYALVHHGVTAHLLTLTTALGSCEGKACTLPAMLVQWLPDAAQTDLDQTLMTRIMNGPRFDLTARYFAAATLREIGRRKPLDAASVEALIVATRGRKPDDRFGSTALTAVEEAALPPRADLIRRLSAPLDDATSRQDRLYPAALLARLAQVSQAEDIPLLVTMMNRFGSQEGPSAAFLVDAMLHIPGPDADARLVNWFSRFPMQATHVALGLAFRPTISKDQLARLVARGDARARMTVLMITHAPNAEATVAQYLANGEIAERAAAAELAAFGTEPSTRAGLVKLLSFHDDRYYPNDVLVRHVAITSLLRRAFVASRKAPATEPTSEAPQN